MLNNYTITLDKLDLMLKHPEPVTVVSDFFGTFDAPAPTAKNILKLSDITAEDPKDLYEYKAVQLYRVDKVIGHYKLQYDIFIFGTYFGYVRLLPTSVSTFFGGEPLVSLSITKKVLYTGKWSSLLESFLNAFNLTINNISYYEIALDSNTDTNTMLVEHFYDNDLHFMSRNSITNNILEVATLYRDGARNSSFYVGKRGLKQVTFYNKTQQTGNNIYTDYQRDFHAANGLDVTQDVYRIEVKMWRKSLKQYSIIYEGKNGSSLTPAQFAKLTDTEQYGYTKKSLVTYRDLTLSDLTNTETLLSLFKLDFEQLIDFRYKDYANKDRCTRLQLIDFNKCKKYILTETITDAMANDTNNIKVQIKSLLNVFKYGKIIKYFTDASELADRHQLTEYFTATQAKLRITAPTLVGRVAPYDYGTRNRPNTFESLF